MIPNHLQDQYEFELVSDVAGDSATDRDENMRSKRRLVAGATNNSGTMGGQNNNIKRSSNMGTAPSVPQNEFDVPLHQSSKTSTMANDTIFFIIRRVFPFFCSLGFLFFILSRKITRKSC